MNDADGSAVVVLSGQLVGRHAARARDDLHDVLATGRGRVVVDLSRVELLDATGLGVLVGAHRRADREGRELVLRGTPPRIARLLTLTRLRRVLPEEPARLSA